MNKEETQQILTVMKAAYPSFYKGITRKDAIATVNLWADIFQDDPAVEVGLAVKSLIATRTNNFPPTIGEVKEELHKRMEPDLH